MFQVHTGCPEHGVKLRMVLKAKRHSEPRDVITTSYMMVLYRIAATQGTAGAGLSAYAHATPPESER